MLSATEAQSQIKLNMREWLDEFKASKMDDPRLIDYAMARVRAIGSPFVPTVGEFIALCDEGRLPAGTKNESDSYAEYLAYDRRPRERREPCELSPETYHTYSVICEMGKNGHLRHSKEQDAEKYWHTMHAKTLEAMKNGQPLKIAPTPVEKLERIRIPASRQTALSALASMRGALA